MGLSDLESLEPKKFTLSEGVFKTPRDIRKPVDIRMRFLLPPKALQPFLLCKLHYWGWNSNVKPVGACPRIIGQACPADDLFARLINRKEFEGKDSPLRNALMRLSSDDKAYANIVLLDEDTGEPITGEPLVYSMGANLSNGPNQSAFHTLKTKFVSWGKMYKGELPWGLEGHDVKITYKPFREYSTIANVEVYPDRGIELSIEDAKLCDLENFATSSQLTSPEVEGVIPDVLGEFSDKILTLDQKYKNSKNEKVETPDVKVEDVLDIGEEVE